MLNILRRCKKRGLHDFSSDYSDYERRAASLRWHIQGKKLTIAKGARSSRAYPKLATIDAPTSELQSASPYERSSSRIQTFISQGEAMSVHSKEEVFSNLDDEVFGTSFLPRPLPKYRFPGQESDPTAAYQLVHDELLLDGNSRQNLATFCQTSADPAVRQLMHDCTAKHIIDTDEHPPTPPTHPPSPHMP